MVTQDQLNRDPLLGPFKFQFQPDRDSAWVHPYFLKYEEMGVAYTHWLYADPIGNPSSWNDPSRWHNGPRVQIVKRTLTFTPTAGNAAADQITNIWGGRNAVVWGKQATVALTSVPATPLRIPNEYCSYVTLQQLGDDGQQNIETSPIENLFGTIPGQPMICEHPEMWWGNAQKTFTVTNNFGSDLTVYLTWIGYVLDTGR